MLDPEDITGGGGAIDTGDQGESYTPPDQTPPSTAGGAIDTSDNSGAAPVVPPAQNQQQGGYAIDTGDNSGAAPVVNPQQPQQSPAPGSANSPSYGPLAGAADMIKKLLGGEGALNPALLDDATKKIDPHGKMTPADRQVAAIHTAYEQHGPDAAMAILQANRVAYGTKAAFARTALTGTQQKPPDLNAAIQAANQAQENLPDGSNVTFSHNGDGVIATAKFPGSDKVVTFNLTVPQFSQFLDVGKDGQFDKMMDVSAPAMLQRLVNTAAGPGAPAQSDAPQQPAAQPQPKAGKQPYKWGRLPDGSMAPSAVDLSGGQETGPREPATNEELGLRDKELEGKSRAMFPNISQETQRQQWMAQQEGEEAKRQNAVDVASEKGKNDIEKAKVTGTGNLEREKVRAQGGVDKAEVYSAGKVQQVQQKLAEMAKAEEGKKDRAKYAAKAHALNAKIAAGGYNSLDDDEKKIFKQIADYTDTPQAAAPKAATPQAPTPKAAAQPSGADQQAMAWAKANPNDPRAAQIMQKLNGAQ